jgi:hypothetical protein
MKVEIQTLEHDQHDNQPNRNNDDDFPFPFGSSSFLAV